jgi:hypothetical protein
MSLSTSSTKKGKIISTIYYKYTILNCVVNYKHQMYWLNIKVQIW